jgi:hypothetical protein
MSVDGAARSSDLPKCRRILNLEQLTLLLSGVALIRPETTADDRLTPGFEDHLVCSDPL